MKKIKQMRFPIDKNLSFGGSALVGKRKDQRPLSPKAPLHLILKSEAAKGETAFIYHAKGIRFELRNLCKELGIKIYEFCIHFNHIHLVLKFPSRAAYISFIRTFTSRVVALISRKVKKPLKSFFTHRPFTRIVSWGRDFLVTVQYIKKNLDEVITALMAKRQYDLLLSLTVESS